MLQRIIFFVLASIASTAFADTLLVGNKARNTLSLVDLGSGEVVKVLPTGVGPHEVDVSPDGKTAVVANYGSAGNRGNTLTVVDVASATVRKTINLGEHSAPHGVVWMQDNEHVVVTTEGSGEIIKVHVDSSEIVLALPTRQQVSHMVALSPDDDTAFVANIGSGSITRLSLAAGATPMSKKTGDGAEGVAVSADGSEVWVSNRADNTLSVLDSSNLVTLAEMKTGDFPVRLEMTPDGKYALVSNGRSSELGVYDVDDKREIKRKKLELRGGKGASIFGDFGASSVPIGIQPHPSKPVIYIAHANGDVVSEISTQNWDILRVIDAGPEPDGMAYSPLDVQAE